MSRKLKTFKPEELLFDSKETKEILLFFFPNEKHSIPKIKVDNKVRGFAQGLLLEAVDASYKMGLVEALFSSTANPTSSMLSVVGKFAIKASIHWFKHAKKGDLRKVKIYESVRRVLQRNFKSVMRLVVQGLDIQGLVSMLSKPSFDQYA